MAKAYAYMLECSDGTLYSGYTVDVKHRLKVHNEGKGSKYTRCRLPVKLVYVEECADKVAAMQRECQLKKLTRPQKLRLISEYQNNIH